jgi:hypothetical protein
MDPEDIRGLNLGAMWNIFRRTGLSGLGPRKGAQRAGKAYVPRDPKASTDTYSIPFNSPLCSSRVDTEEKVFRCLEQSALHYRVISNKLPVYRAIVDGVLGLTFRSPHCNTWVGTEQKLFRCHE